MERPVHARARAALHEQRDAQDISYVHISADPFVNFIYPRRLTLAVAHVTCSLQIFIRNRSTIEGS
jgi:hypothetical protein